MKLHQAQKKLAATIDYILGRRPDKFGLVPNPDGYIKIKDLLKALSEEPGWRHVRRSHIDEIVITLPQAPMEINEPFIRSRNRPPESPGPAQNLPKLLFCAVRRKAYPTTLEKGLYRPSFPGIILSDNLEMAERIGKRSDPKPVIVTVHVNKSIEAGVLFSRVGETLCRTESLPPECISGPPLPKAMESDHPKEKPAKPVEQNPHAGSFILNLDQEERDKKRTKRQRAKKEISWKKERRQGNKQDVW
jgi:putative RNA 2'-phosphotransferase